MFLPVKVYLQQAEKQMQRAIARRDIGERFGMMISLRRAAQYTLLACKADAWERDDWSKFHALY